ncbi:unnamed protein product [Brassica napus]|uniref:(rape) hypothetical protein n=1 Tax=Brassica napus TaxID=3708 RepID=A0A816S0S4_BRANA|nr:unnamed protein product [Brassica napus]
MCTKIKYNLYTVCVIDFSFLIYMQLMINIYFFFFLIIQGFPASRVIPLGPVRQRSTSPGRAIPGLDRTQYRFGVQKRQNSFRMGRESNPDGGCHHRPVLPLGLSRPDN